MKRILLVIGIIVIALTLTACGGSDGPRKGIVVGRSYDDPDDWTSVVMVPCGKGCMIPITQYHHDDERFLIELKNHGRKGWWEVSRHVYDECHKGDFCSARMGRIERQVEEDDGFS